MANNINVCNKTVFKLVLFGKHMRWCVEIKLHTGRQRAKSNVLYGANRIRFFFNFYTAVSHSIYRYLYKRVKDYLAPVHWNQKKKKTHKHMWSFFFVCFRTNKFEVNLYGFYNNNKSSMIVIRLLEISYEPLGQTAFLVYLYIQIVFPYLHRSAGNEP